MSGLLVFISGMFVGAATLIILALSLGAQEWEDSAVEKYHSYKPQNNFLRGAESLRLSR